MSGILSQQIWGYISNKTKFAKRTKEKAIKSVARSQIHFRKKV